MHRALLNCALRAVVVACLLGAVKAEAHDTWANGMTIPAWVKKACCGEDDVHRLNLDDVTQEADGWHIAGIEGPVREDHVFASQDEHVWGFWSPYLHRGENVYCLFVPLSF
jgi:hypothetical protein